MHFARTSIGKRCSFVKCNSIIIEKDTEAFRKVKKRALMCKLIIFLPFCYFSFKQGWKLLLFEKLSIFLVSIRHFWVETFLRDGSGEWATLCKIP